jgi:ArsR family transcriptional regulator, arsenate/arsenite/antimonite-responsive transcriptional repressor
VFRVSATPIHFTVSILSNLKASDQRALPGMRQLTFLFYSKYHNDMKTPQFIAALGALAHEHRLAIYRRLVERGPLGLPAGAIAERVGLVPSSLTFHLQALQRAGLIVQRREGRQLIYSADYDAMDSLVGYLTENCCAERDPACATECSPISGTSKVRDKSRRIA